MRLWFAAAMMLITALIVARFWRFLVVVAFLALGAYPLESG
ncbi:MAG: hypothetical protein ACREJQ_05595 [bacterium]